MHIQLQIHSWTHTIKTTSKSIKQLKATLPTEKHNQAKPPYHIMKNIQALTLSFTHMLPLRGAKQAQRLLRLYTLIPNHDNNSKKDLQTVKRLIQRVLKKNKVNDQMITWTNNIHVAKG